MRKSFLGLLAGAVVYAASSIGAPTVAFAQCAKMPMMQCSQCKMNKNPRLSPSRANASCENAKLNKQPAATPVSGKPRRAG